MRFLAVHACGDVHEQRTMHGVNKSKVTDHMKALTVRQPIACLMPEGIKTIEVRSWPTDHRGELLICASAAPKNIFWMDPDDKVPRLLPSGCMIGIMRVTACRRMVKADAELALCPFDNTAFAWVLEPVCSVRPDKVRGALRLFDVPDDTIIRLKEPDWIFNYPAPQGDIKYTKGKPLLDFDAVE